jgi:hypothetical protein
MVATTINFVDCDMYMPGFSPSKSSENQSIYHSGPSIHKNNSSVFISLSCLNMQGRMQNVFNEGVQGYMGHFLDPFAMNILNCRKIGTKSFLKGKYTTRIHPVSTPDKTQQT